MVDLHDERDGVATLVTAEAVPQPHLGPDLERRGLLVVERAQALQRAGAGPAQGHVVADQLVQVDPFLDCGDVLVLDPPGHPVSLGARPGITWA